MVDMHADYSPPLALTVISAVFLILGAICFLIIVGDIVWRRGWNSMMWIMIPVYPINAAYMLPLELYVYFKFGRPTKPEPPPPTDDVATEKAHQSHDTSPNRTEDEPAVPTAQHENIPSQTNPANENGSNDPNLEKGPSESGEASHCHHHSSARPMWATVLIGVSHCGAGCVLGDIVGEWLVYGTNATLGGAMIWVELLVDYAFALLFGVAFQYFSIAPMSGDYGPKSVWRALKADFLSLTSFEVGAFGWMQPKLPFPFHM
ncbi:uncharacterized protein LTR77_000992 [Saxophila tyrrhenica]|uniref:DUF4396 domain-containing protein n=1 Tax=Saxophila tyrrhenica TaxID=1690608 RepID=A0AAV9PSF5_9PEZI|nr:hypothetical protein LTR77_000992 [Saxophila tyrrhenica]